MRTRSSAAMARAFSSAWGVPGSCARIASTIWKPTV